MDIASISSARDLSGHFMQKSSGSSPAPRSSIQHPQAVSAASRTVLERPAEISGHSESHFALRVQSLLILAGFVLATSVFSRRLRTAEPIRRPGVRRLSVRRPLPPSRCPAPFTRLSLCISVISCDRPWFLNRTVPALIDHLTRYEPCIDYELNWIDQGTKERPYFSARFRFHKRVFFHKRQGYQTAFRQAHFLCTAPYILFLEEDRLVGDVRWPIISHSIEMLRSAPFDVYGVLLQIEPTVGHLGGPLVHLLLRSPYKSRAEVWAFTTRAYMYVNGAAVYRTENIHKMLELEGYQSEEQFSALVGKLHWKFVFPKVMPGKKTPFVTPAYFTHLGEGHSTTKNDVCRAETFN
jgi:hypothetical protein